MKPFILSCLAFVFIVSCNREPAKEPAAEASEPENSVTLSQAQERTASLKTGKLELKNLGSLLRVTGTIEVPPQSMVSISVPMGGYLKSTKLLEGLHVKKGEVIAMVEGVQYIELQEQFLAAKTMLDKTEKDFLRQQALNENKSTSDKIFQQVQSDFKSQKLNVKALGEKLKLIGLSPEKLTEENISGVISIISPIDGFVSSVHANIGKYVNPTDVISQLVNPTDIHLVLTVYEKDLDKLFIGQPFHAWTNHDSNKKYKGEIILIGHDISPERNVLVHCHFDEYDKALIPGMFMNSELEVSSRKAFVIPNNGVIRFEGKDYVFAESGKGNYKMTEVTLLNNENGFTQISFKDTVDYSNQIFVTSGAYTLLMALKNKGDD